MSAAHSHLTALDRLLLARLALGPDGRMAFGGETLDEIAREVLALREAAQATALPPADLDVAALAQRERKSTSRIRELVVAGAWGAPGAAGGPYRDAAGRWRVPLAAVLQRDVAQREAGRDRQHEEDVDVLPAVPSDSGRHAGTLRDAVRRNLPSGASTRGPG